LQGKTTIIATDGTETVQDHNQPLTLEFMQAAVGGYIELISTFDYFRGDRCVALCNEEGKISHDRAGYNAKATEHWHSCHGLNGDYLVGPVLIIQGDAEFLATL
jgi:hypothetical protein